MIPKAFRFILVQSTNKILDLIQDAMHDRSGHNRMEIVEGFTRVFPELDIHDGIFVKMNYAVGLTQSLHSDLNTLVQ
eukprot:5395968-Amphidinium_carterae.1